jgi:hypothetical protein
MAEVQRLHQCGLLIPRRCVGRNHDGTMHKQDSQEQGCDTHIRSQPNTRHFGVACDYRTSLMERASAPIVTCLPFSEEHQETCRIFVTLRVLPEQPGLLA